MNQGRSTKTEAYTAQNSTHEGEDQQKKNDFHKQDLGQVDPMGENEIGFLLPSINKNQFHINERLKV